MKGKTIFLILVIFINFNLLGEKLGPFDIIITFEPEKGNNPGTLFHFSTEESEKAILKEKIKSRLTEDFVSAWNALENNISILPSCYQSAFIEYKKYLKTTHYQSEAKKIQFEVEFIIDEYFRWYMVNQHKYHFTLENFPGDIDGNANPGRVDPKQFFSGNKVAIRNVYAENFKYLKYSKKKTCDYKTIVSYSGKYLFDINYPQFRNDLYWKKLWLIKNCAWQEVGVATFSLKYAFVHELLHIIVKRYVPIMSRWADEATIEDAAKMICSIGEYGPYEYSFDFMAWMLNNASQGDKVNLKLSTFEGFRGQVSIIKIAN